MRMLIVEDDRQLRELLGASFRDAGWAVELVPDGREGRYYGIEYPCDIAIVDLGLPDLSGIDLIRQWRAAGRIFPVLILTARGDWRDKVEGLEAGADDYVTKPFRFEEVAARVAALLRRAAGRATAAVEFGEIRIDFSARRVSRAGKALELTSFEYNTLEYLASRPGSVVSKAELTDHLYEEDQDRDSNVIEVFIGRLRRKLDPDQTLQPIETVRGAGYRFVLRPVDA
ncbi:MAG: response regulator transcription factor [Halioglobus sp.]